MKGIQGEHDRLNHHWLHNSDYVAQSIIFKMTYNGVDCVWSLIMIVLEVPNKKPVSSDPKGIGEPIAALLGQHATKIC